MATYTTNIRLTKQNTGENDSTWGEVLNDEVIQLVDSAIAGYTTISLAGGDVSLTANDGEADQARSGILELNGTITTATGVYLPAVTKSYIVWNNTSGSFDTTILVNGGTGHVLPQGQTAIVYSDSVSVRPLTVGTVSGNISVDNVSVSGTLDVAGITTLDSNVSVGGTLDVNGDTTLYDNELVRPILKDYGEKVNALGSGSGTRSIDLTLGNIISATVATGTNTFTFSNPTATGNNCGFALYLTNGGSQTVNWPGSVDWPSGTAPTLTASGIDILVFNTIDGGTTWYGNLVSANYS